MNPYKIEPPFVVQFSGGRTSAYMLWHVLDAHGGKLPEGAVVAFQNTGKERRETLDFVHDIERRWAVDVTWLEYCVEELESDGTTIRSHSFRAVDYETASRSGEPFEAIINKRSFLPNPVARFCTVELKILTCERYLLSLGWDDWYSAVGVRYDEPRRWSKLRGKNKRAHGETVLPLVDARVTMADVDQFWSQQDFDLALMPHEGNCDLCFLKGRGRLQEIMRRRPELVDWWARQEQQGRRFRSDRPTYAQLLSLETEQMGLFDDASIGCFCGD